MNTNCRGNPPWLPHFHSGEAGRAREVIRIKNWVNWCKAKAFSEEQLQESYSCTRIKFEFIPLIVLPKKGFL